MKQKSILLLAFVLMGWMQSCMSSESHTPSGSANITFEPDTDTQPVLATEGGSTSLTFTATEAWTASVSETGTRAIDWLSVSPTSGEAGTATLVITALANDTYDERNAAVTVACGIERKVITITQKQQDALMVTSNKVEVEAEGGEFEIELKSNVSVTYEIEESARAWLSAASDTRALTVSTLRFHAEGNTDTEPRQGVITLNGDNGLTEEVTVYQLGSGPALVLTQTEYVVGSDGETIQVELKSNNTYQIEMPPVDWIKEADTRALSTYTHYFTVAPNETYDAREAVIRFVDRENGLEQTVTVTQMQRDAIVVAQDTYEVPTVYSRLELPVQANVNFTVETDVDWINLREEDTKGLTESVLTFSIAPYMQSGDREGHIILISNAGITQTIRVIQKGTIAYIKILSRGDTIVDCGENYTGMTVEFGFAHNFKISTPDWILENSSIYTDETDTGHIHEFIFIIKPNESAESRTGFIRFYDDEYGVSDEMKVTQEGNRQSEAEGGIDDMPIEPW